MYLNDDYSLIRPGIRHFYNRFVNRMKGLRTMDAVGDKHVFTLMLAASSIVQSPKNKFVRSIGWKISYTLIHALCMHFITFTMPSHFHPVRKVQYLPKRRCSTIIHDQLPPHIKTLSHQPLSLSPGYSYLP